MPPGEISSAPNWIVLFPVVTGFLAVWYLLPTPRRRPMINAILGVVIAVLGFGTFLFHGFGDDLPFSSEGFLFASFALLAFTFGILMIVQRNPARAALFFAVVVLSVCGMFLLLAAPFLMAATIIIYAGAIIVTFLFVIMLSQQTRQTDANDRSRAVAGRRGRLRAARHVARRLAVRLSHERNRRIDPAERSLCPGRKSGRQFERPHPGHSLFGRR